MMDDQEYFEHEELKAKIEAQQELIENWEKTAETYKFRLDNTLRDNADLAAEKQALLALIDEAEHSQDCVCWQCYPDGCDCFKSKARGE